MKVNLKLNVAVVLHVFLIAGQAVNALGLVVPQKDQFYVAGLLGVIQAIVGVLQHLSPAPASSANGQK